MEDGDESGSDAESDGLAEVPAASDAEGQRVPSEGDRSAEDIAAPPDGDDNVSWNSDAEKSWDDTDGEVGTYNEEAEEELAEQALREEAEAGERNKQAATKLQQMWRYFAARKRFAKLKEQYETGPSVDNMLRGGLTPHEIDEIVQPLLQEVDEDYENLKLRDESSGSKYYHILAAKAAAISRYHLIAAEEFAREATLMLQKAWEAEDKLEDSDGESEEDTDSDLERQKKEEEVRTRIQEAKQATLQEAYEKAEKVKEEAYERGFKKAAMEWAEKVQDLQNEKQKLEEDYKKVDTKARKKDKKKNDSQEMHATMSMQSSPQKLTIDSRGLEEIASLDRKPSAVVRGDLGHYQQAFQDFCRQLTEEGDDSRPSRRHGGSYRLPCRKLFNLMQKLGRHPTTQQLTNTALELAESVIDMLSSLFGEDKTLDLLLKKPETPEAYLRFPTVAAFIARCRVDSAYDNGASRSIALFGLPTDVTEREIHVLFSSCPGFVAATLGWPSTSGRPEAAAEFEKPENAATALESRSGTHWTPHTYPVRMELAPEEYNGGVTALFSKLHRQAEGKVAQRAYLETSQPMRKGVYLQRVAALQDKRDTGDQGWAADAKQLATDVLDEAERLAVRSPERGGVSIVQLSGLKAAFGIGRVGGLSCGAFMEWLQSGRNSKYKRFAGGGGAEATSTLTLLEVQKALLQYLADEIGTAAPPLSPRAPTKSGNLCKAMRASLQLEKAMQTSKAGELERALQVARNANADEELLLKAEDMLQQRQQRKTATRIYGNADRQRVALTEVTEGLVILRQLVLARNAHPPSVAERVEALERLIQRALSAGVDSQNETVEHALRLLNVEKGRLEAERLLLQALDNPTQDLQSAFTLAKERGVDRGLVCKAAFALAVRKRQAAAMASLKHATGRRDGIYTQVDPQDPDDLRNPRRYSFSGEITNKQMLHDSIHEAQETLKANDGILTQSLTVTGEIQRLRSRSTKEKEGSSEYTMADVVRSLHDVPLTLRKILVQGDWIEIWNADTESWLTGVVSEVAKRRGVRDGFSVVHGSLKVSTVKGLLWIAPQDQPRMIKDFFEPPPKPIIEVVVGEYIDVWSEERTMFMPGVVDDLATGADGMDDDGDVETYPSGSVKVTSLQTNFWILPNETYDLIRKHEGKHHYHKDDHVSIYAGKKDLWRPGVIFEVHEDADRQDVRDALGRCVHKGAVHVRYTTQEGRTLEKWIQPEDFQGSSIRPIDPVFSIREKVGVCLPYRDPHDEVWHSRWCVGVVLKLVPEEDAQKAGIEVKTKTEIKVVERHEFAAWIKKGAAVKFLGRYNRGDEIEFLHHEKHTWYQGIVEDVLQEDAEDLPVGSLRASYQATPHHRVDAWIKLHDIGTSIKSVRKHFVVGDKVDVYSHRTRLWLEGTVEDRLEQEEQKGSRLLPEGSLMISTAKGNVWVQPSEEAELLKAHVVHYKKGTLVWVGLDEKLSKATVVDFCKEEFTLDGDRMPPGSVKVHLPESDEEVWIQVEEVPDIIKGIVFTVKRHQQLHVYDERTHQWTSAWVDKVWETEDEFDGNPVAAASALLWTHHCWRIVLAEEMDELLREATRDKFAVHEAVDVYSSSKMVWQSATVACVTEDSSTVVDGVRYFKGSIKVVANGKSKWIPASEVKRLVRRGLPSFAVDDRVEYWYLPEDDQMTNAWSTASRVKTTGEDKMNDEGQWIPGHLIDVNPESVTFKPHGVDPTTFGAEAMKIMSHDDFAVTRSEWSNRLRKWRPVFSRGEAIALWHGETWKGGVVEKVSYTDGGGGIQPGSVRVAVGLPGKEQTRIWIEPLDVLRNVIREHQAMFRPEEYVELRSQKSKSESWDLVRVDAGEHVNMAPTTGIDKDKTPVHILDPTGKSREIDPNDATRMLRKLKFEEGDKIMYKAFPPEDDEAWMTTVVEAVAKEFFKTESQSVAVSSLRLAGVSHWILPSDIGLCCKPAGADKPSKGAAKRKAVG
eukprot:TRINITY_DN35580_c0_g1_i1.p1 TRINITY_DN35580_c0_g1~~TRINITY_DN35580_c0_g1_i1.p1  ORF type:complete len:1969 (-),score=491.39 TRINITY_DN35580_c0_g1_i1:453-6359(-)